MTVASYAEPDREHVEVEAGVRLGDARQPERERRRRRDGGDRREDRRDDADEEHPGHPDAPQLSPVIPSERSSRYPWASVELCRASSCSATTSPATASSPASIHSATAWRWIERWVLRVLGAGQERLGGAALAEPGRAPSITAGPSATWCSRITVNGCASTSWRCARVNAGVTHTTSMPAPACGGNSDDAASTPDDVQRERHRCGAGRRLHPDVQVVADAEVERLGDGEADRHLVGS